MVKISSGRGRIIAVHGPGGFTGDIGVLARRRSVVGAKARVSSAIGEGAMAVQFVHEYLSRKET
ncbi:MAG TPA: hypothetical protein VF046_07125 [Gemmatimonadales bacterium]